MKKTTNSATIEGYVFNHSLQKRVTGPQTKTPGTEFIMGELQIAVDEEGLNVVPVHFTYITANGRRQKTYDILSNIIDDPNTTWAQGGKENALKVSVNGQVGLNEFYTKDDNGEDRLVSVKRIEGGFVNEILRDSDMSDLAKRNTFMADMLVRGVKFHEEETRDNGDVYPAYAAVKGYFFDFRGAALPVELRIESEKGIEFFMENDGMVEPNFRKVWGHIDCLTVKREVVEESAFGEASVRIVNSTVKKWLIDGCAQNPYEYGDPDILCDEEMNKKMQERHVYLADIKKRAEEYRANKNKEREVIAAPTQNKPAFTVKKDTGVFNF